MILREQLCRWLAEWSQKVTLRKLVPILPSCGHRELGGGGRGGPTLRHYRPPVCTAVMTITTQKSIFMEERRGLPVRLEYMYVLQRAYFVVVFMIIIIIIIIIIIFIIIEIVIIISISISI